MLLCASIFAFSSSAHAGELYVNVTDTFGHAFENVTVAVKPVGLSAARKKARRNKPFLIRRTDKLGRFLFVRVQPGKHYLTAKHRATPASRICYLETEIQIDYPENVESHSVEITLRSVRRYKVSGRVLGVGGLPYQQLVIFFEPQVYPGEAKPPFTRMAVSSTAMGDSKYTFLAEDTNYAWVPLIEECSKRLPARLVRSTYPKIKKDCCSTASRLSPIPSLHLNLDTVFWSGCAKPKTESGLGPAAHKQQGSRRGVSGHACRKSIRRFVWPQRAESGTRQTVRPVVAVPRRIGARQNPRALSRAREQAVRLESIDSLAATTPPRSWLRRWRLGPSWLRQSNPRLRGRITEQTVVPHTRIRQSESRRRPPDLPKIQPPQI